MLAELEVAGLDFGSVLTGASGAPASLAALSRTPELASVAGVLADDLRQVQRLDQMTCSGCPQSGCQLRVDGHAAP